MTQTFTLATGKDIDKLVVFTDDPSSDYKTYGILYDVDLREDLPYVRKGDFSQWRYARRLTTEEVMELC